MPFIRWSSQILLTSTSNNRTALRLLLIFLTFVSVGGCQKSTDSSKFQLLGGGQKSISDYRGRWLLVNFWAEWCRPCLEEVPELNEIHHNRKELGVELLAFSYEPIQNEQLVSAQQRFGIEYPMVATEPQPIVPFKRPAKLPAMLYISPNGEVFGPVFGKQDLNTVKETLSKLKQQS